MYASAEYPNMIVFKYVQSVLWTLLIMYNKNDWSNSQFKKTKTFTKI